MQTWTPCIYNVYVFLLGLAPLHREMPAWKRHRNVRVSTPYLQVGTADVRVGPVENATYSSVKVSLWRETEAETTNRTTGP